jgi:hypothetical protein
VSTFVFCLLQHDLDCSETALEVLDEFDKLANPEAGVKNWAVIASKYHRSRLLSKRCAQLVCRYCSCHFTPPRAGLCCSRRVLVLCMIYVSCVVVRAYIMRRDESPAKKKANKEEAVALAKEVVALAERGVEDQESNGDGAVLHCCLMFLMCSTCVCCTLFVYARPWLCVCLTVLRSLEVLPWRVLHEQVSCPQACGQT